ncbi:MAG: o-succinylbenzoate synthase [bacterium]|nr:o-succinylbenzoate synthase [bacterium]
MSGIHHTPIAVKLREPLLTARGAIYKRRGFLTGMVYNGHPFVSEIALLPEFGTEHFEHAERVLNNETIILAGAPATVYALDCLRYAAEKSRDEQVAVPVSKLIGSGTLEKVLDEVAHDVAAGYSTFKLKVGFRNLAEDIAIVNSLFLTWPDIRLRLDANLNWTPQAVQTLSEQPCAMSVEWVEDPFRGSMDEWRSLQERTGILLATDEAFSEQQMLEHVDALGFGAAVIKPSRLGALGERERVFVALRDRNVTIVFSSMFDSSIGIAYLAHLAHDWSRPDVAQGIGTLDLLASDTTTTTFAMLNGSLVIPPLAELHALLKPEFRAALQL